MQALRLATTVALALAGLHCAAPTQAAECDNAYFAADDSQRRSPLRQPSPEFLADLKAARQGNVVAQRNLGVSYETGYLVSPCQDKAITWYAKAADGGDEFADKALARLRQFAALHDGAECQGNCASSTSATSATLQARGNHFYAPVTVNGRTLEGVIDTGATLVSMSADTAKSFGIDYAGGSRGKSQTANGITDIRVVTVPSINVAGITVHNINVAVGDSKHPILIGMAFLKHVRTRIDGNTLTMTR